ncbi:hypothetical protein P148_SR1C00001G0861 [candidate division SR1 bacterium RAAC1_SR1_1]|nr:hypothetical protein P148_SR1C00001G0861 [candidate division SR1 bacterium RAAC1_SR1_1]
MTQMNPKQHMQQILIILGVAIIIVIGFSFFQTNRVISWLENNEAQKVGGQENYETIQKIYGSDTFKSQQKASLGQALGQMQGNTNGNDNANTKQTQQEQPKPTNITKSDKPAVDLFIMSYCPYGLQAQKGILDVMKKMGNVADIKIKFVHYLMHGKKEAEENVRQYCIQDQQKDKYTKYLECFLKEEGKSESCLSEVGIDTSKLNSCYTDTFKKYNIEELLASGGQNPSFPVNADESKSFGVQGSPTLVINGAIVNAGRSANDYKEAICNAFNDKPAICNEDFVKVPYDPMFGFTSNGKGVAGGCGQ